MATEKQKEAFDKTVENGGNITQAMRDAKYKETTINSPKNLTESDGWKELVEEFLPDKDLAKVHKEGLKAFKKEFKNNMSSGEVEEVSNEPDYMIRHKYLDTAYKVKGSYAPEKRDVNVTLPSPIIQLDNVQPDDSNE